MSYLCESIDLVEISAANRICIKNMVDVEITSELMERGKEYAPLNSISHGSSSIFNMKPVQNKHLLAFSDFLG